MDCHHAGTTDDEKQAGIQVLFLERQDSVGGKAERCPREKKTFYLK